MNKQFASTQLSRITRRLYDPPSVLIFIVIRKEMITQRYRAFGRLGSFVTDRLMWRLLPEKIYENGTKIPQIPWLAAVADLRI